MYVECLFSGVNNGKLSNIERVKYDVVSEWYMIKNGCVLGTMRIYVSIYTR
jgi:hypothetical protein